MYIGYRETGSSPVVERIVIRTRKMRQVVTESWPVLYLEYDLREHTRPQTLCTLSGDRSQAWGNSCQGNGSWLIVFHPPVALGWA